MNVLKAGLRKTHWKVVLNFASVKRSEIDRNESIYCVLHIELRRSERALSEVGKTTRHNLHDCKRKKETSGGLDDDSSS